MPPSLAEQFLQQERRSWADQFDQMNGGETEDEWIRKWEKEQEELKSTYLSAVTFTHSC